MADQDTRLNAYWGRPVVALLDALHSTPVGLTAININLSKGSQAMAASGVIVRRLTAIENFGSMDVLCTDKTGTLTEGVVRLDAAVDARGAPSDEVLRFAYLNAAFQTGLVNPLDEAIIARAGQAGLGTEPYTKVDEIPYDFIRKRLSVVVGQENGRSDAALPLMITKGALENVLAICTQVQDSATVAALDDAQREEIEGRYADWSGQGYRVLGVGVKSLPRASGAAVPIYTLADNREALR